MWTRDPETLLARFSCKAGNVFERKTGYLAHCAVGQITVFLSKTYTPMREQPPRPN